MEELKCHFYNNIAIVAIIFVIMIMIIITLNF